VASQEVSEEILLVLKHQHSEVPFGTGRCQGLVRLRAKHPIDAPPNSGDFRINLSRWRLNMKKGDFPARYV
jgi:hypothetical protein